MFKRQATGLRPAVTYAYPPATGLTMSSIPRQFGLRVFGLHCGREIGGALRTREGPHPTRAAGRRPSTSGETPYTTTLRGDRLGRSGSFLDFEGLDRVDPMVMADAVDFKLNLVANLMI